MTSLVNAMLPRDTGALALASRRHWNSALDSCLRHCWQGLILRALH